MYDNNVRSKPEYNYKLISFICHHGSTVNSGHYTSYISSRNIWYHVNDLICTNVGEELSLNGKSLKEQVYLIIYERNSPFDS